MANLGNYYRDLILNILNKQTVTPPANFYFAFCSSLPVASQTGTTIPELTNAGGYARILTTYNPASGGSISNALATAAVSTTAWSASATHWALVDSASIGAGNMWLFGPLKGTSDVQTVSTSGQLSSGTYTLNPNGVTTVAIPYNATAAQITEYLEAAAGAGNISAAFSGNRFDQATPSSLVITFGGTLDSANQTLMTVTPSAIVGGVLSILHTTPGAPGTITVAGVGQTASIPATNASWAVS